MLLEESSEVRQINAQDIADAAADQELALLSLSIAMPSSSSFSVVTTMAGMTVE